MIKLKRRLPKVFTLLSAFLMSWMIFTASIVNATPDPVEVSWYVTGVSGTPIDGASLTIYWSTSTSGPFAPVPADSPDVYVYDKIANVKQNPIATGYWNPEMPHGMAVCALHPKGGLAGLYFYVEITASGSTWYWPVATSTKPGSPSWTPVAATGSPSGYAADIGTGPGTAYPTCGLLSSPFVIPEAPGGPVMAVVSMTIAFWAYLMVQKRKIPVP